jgi:hypothetical protein
MKPKATILCQPVLFEWWLFLAGLVMFINHIAIFQKLEIITGQSTS